MDVYFVAILLFAALLGLIPAGIAKNKGYSFGAWWLYGWMLFIVALIHVSVIPDRNAQQYLINQYNPVPHSPPPVSTQSTADELRKYKQLFDDGVITEEEFNAKKEQILKLM